MTLCWGLAACDAAESQSTTPPPEGGKTLGFVLASYDYLFYKSPGAKEECPKGFTPNNREEWEAQFPTKEQQAANLGRGVIGLHVGGQQNQGTQTAGQQRPGCAGGNRQPRQSV